MDSSRNKKHLIVHHKNKRYLVVAMFDFDGTLVSQEIPENQLHKTAKPAQQALKQLSDKGAVICIATSRTLGEMLYYQRFLGNIDMYICEDGGVVVPMQHTNLTTLPSQYRKVKQENTDVIALSSLTIDDIEKFIISIENKACKIQVDQCNKSIIATCRANDDRKIKEIANYTTISVAQASMRRLSSAYVLNPTPIQHDLLSQQKNKQIRIHGEPQHIMGTDVDKGKAIAFLREHAKTFFSQVNEQKLDGLFIVSFGNSGNDIAMFQQSDMAILVSHPDKKIGYYVDRSSVPDTVLLASKPNGYGILESLPSVLKRLHT